MQVEIDACRQHNLCAQHKMLKRLQRYFLHEETGILMGLAHLHQIGPNTKATSTSTLAATSLMQMTAMECDYIEKIRIFVQLRIVNEIIADWQELNME